MREWEQSQGRHLVVLSWNHNLTTCLKDCRLWAKQEEFNSLYLFGILNANESKATGVTRALVTLRGPWRGSPHSGVEALEEHKETRAGFTWRGREEGCEHSSALEIPILTWHHRSPPAVHSVLHYSSNLLRFSAEHESHMWFAALIKVWKQLSV